MKSPQDYKQWRSKLHEAWMQLGMMLDTDAREHRCSRSIYRLRSRIKRIKARMEAEIEAGTRSFFQALLDQAMRRWKGRK